MNLTRKTRPEKRIGCVAGRGEWVAAVVQEEERWDGRRRRGKRMDGR
jgi:hypothetical protein